MTPGEPMKRILQFLRTTLVGGILFLVPIVVLAVVLDKALVLTRRIVDPLAEHLPVHSVIGLRTPILLAIALMVLFCFLAGLLAHAAFARRLVNRLETAVLSRMPGYELMKRAGESMLGVEKESSYVVVLVRLDDTWQLALQTGQLDNGLLAVFIPEAPGLQSGAVHFITADRVRPTGVPLAAAMKILQQYGAGSGALQRSLSAAGAADTKLG